MRKETAKSGHVGSNPTLSAKKVNSPQSTVDSQRTKPTSEGHSREKLALSLPKGGNPASPRLIWTPACAGVTTGKSLEINVGTGYPAAMGGGPETQFAAELGRRLGPFCQKHHIRRLEVFGSAARGQAGPRSDVDLLVTLDESTPVSAAALLEMAGEAEELVGAPVDFVLRSSLEKSPNRFARDHILSTAVCVYGT